MFLIPSCESSKTCLSSDGGSSFGFCSAVWWHWPIISSLFVAMLWESCYKDKCLNKYWWQMHINNHSGHQQLIVLHYGTDVAKLCGLTGKVELGKPRTLFGHHPYFCISSTVSIIIRKTTYFGKELKLKIIIIIII